MNCCRNDDYLGILETLLECGDDANARNVDDMTLFLEVIIEGTVSAVSLFVKHGADVLAKDTDGRSALHHACDSSDEMLKFVLEMDGIEVEQRDNFGTTALHDASSGCHSSKIRTLVARGADVNAKDKNGETPFHHYLRWLYKPEHKEAVKLLLALGAELHHEIHDEPEKGCTCLDLALHEENIDVANIIVEHALIQSEMKNERQTLSARDLQSIDSRPSLKDHQQACRAELQKMRERKVAGSSVSFLRDLVDSVDWVDRYARNPDIVQVFEAAKKYDCIKTFTYALFGV